MSFTPTGELRLQLFTVGVDEHGERDYRTVVNVTDTLENLREVWFYALAARLGVGRGELEEIAAAVQSPPPAADDKPKRGRPRKQAAPAAEAGNAPGPTMTAGGGAGGTVATVTGPAVTQVATGVASHTGRNDSVSGPAPAPADPLHTAEDQAAPAPAPAPPVPARVNPFAQG